MYTFFFKFIKKRELVHALRYVPHVVFFLLNNTSWHLFLIHFIHFISAWSSNLWTCHNLVNQYPINGKTSFKDFSGPLGSSCAIHQ